MTLLREPLCLNRGSLDKYLVVMVSEGAGLDRRKRSGTIMTMTLYGIEQAVF